MRAHCVIIYSECDYKGKHLEVCDDIADLVEEHNFPRTRSLYIPKEFRKLPVWLHTQKHFKGRKEGYKKSATCIKKDVVKIFF